MLINNCFLASWNSITKANKWRIWANKK